MHLRNLMMIKHRQRKDGKKALQKGKKLSSTWKWGREIVSPEFIERVHPLRFLIDRRRSMEWLQKCVNCWVKFTHCGCRVREWSVRREHQCLCGCRGSEELRLSALVLFHPELYAEEKKWITKEMKELKVLREEKREWVDKKGRGFCSVWGGSLHVCEESIWKLSSSERVTIHTHPHHTVKRNSLLRGVSGESGWFNKIIGVSVRRMELWMLLWVRISVNAWLKEEGNIFVSSSARWVLH